MIDSSLLIWGGIPWLVYILFVLVVTNTKGWNTTVKMKYLMYFSILFAALRYGIGYDYYSYKAIVEGAAQDYQMERWNILPQLLGDFCRPIHFQLFFVITSILAVYPVYFVCNKLSENKVLSFTVFLFYPQFYLMGLGPVRNYVAFSMALLLFYHWFYGRKVYAIICYIIAIGFHTSAITAGVLFFIPSMSRSRALHFTLFLISFVLSVFVIPFLTNVSSFIGVENQVSYYLENADKYSGGGLYRIIVNVIALVNLLNWQKLSKNSELNARCLVLFNIGACVWNLLLPISTVLATRLAMFFLFYLILFVPTYCKVLSKKHLAVKNVIVSFCLLLFVFTFVMQYYNYLNSGIRMSNYPYQFFFNSVDLSNSPLFV